MLGSYFIFFVVIGILHAIFPSFDINQYQQTDLNELIKETPFKFMILAVILAPIMEEGMFRSIVKPSKNELIFFICTWIIVIAAPYIPEDIYWALKFGFLILLAILLFVFLREFIPNSWLVNISYFLNKYYIYVWFLTSVIFGMVHIYNYVEGFKLDFILFIMIFPRIIAGFFFGKIKIENKGLGWSMAMHAMNNTTVLFFLFPKLLSFLV